MPLKQRLHSIFSHSGSRRSLFSLKSRKSTTGSDTNIRYNNKISMRFDVEQGVDAGEDMLTDLASERIIDSTCTTSTTNDVTCFHFRLLLTQSDFSLANHELIINLYSCSQRKKKKKISSRGVAPSLTVIASKRVTGEHSSDLSRQPVELIFNNIHLHSWKNEAIYMTLALVRKCPISEEMTSSTASGNPEHCSLPHRQWQSLRRPVGLAIVEITYYIWGCRSEADIEFNILPTGEQSLPVVGTRHILGDRRRINEPSNSPLSRVRGLMFVEQSPTSASMGLVEFFIVLHSAKSRWDNLEVEVLLYDEDGSVLNKPQFSSTESYRSVVYRHTGTPVWKELVIFDLPEQISPKAYLFLILKHWSDISGKCDTLGTSKFHFKQEDGAFVPNGIHKVHFQTSPENPTSTVKLEIFLDSHKHTQYSSITGLTNPSATEVERTLCLKAIIGETVPTDELLKFLPTLINACLAIIDERGNHSSGSVEITSRLQARSFEALIYLLNKRHLLSSAKLLELRETVLKPGRRANFGVSLIACLNHALRNIYPPDNSNQWSNILTQLQFILQTALRRKTPVNAAALTDQLKLCLGSLVDSCRSRVIVPDYLLKNVLGLFEDLSAEADCDELECWLNDQLVELVHVANSVECSESLNFYQLLIASPMMTSSGELAKTQKLLEAVVRGVSVNMKGLLLSRRRSNAQYDTEVCRVTQCLLNLLRPNDGAENHEECYGGQMSCVLDALFSGYLEIILSLENPVYRSAISGEVLNEIVSQFFQLLSWMSWFMWLFVLTSLSRNAPSPEDGSCSPGTEKEMLLGNELCRVFLILSSPHTQKIFGQSLLDQAYFFPGLLRVVDEFFTPLIFGNDGCCTAARETGTTMGVGILRVLAILITKPAQSNYAPDQLAKTFLDIWNLMEYRQKSETYEQLSNSILALFNSEHIQAVNAALEVILDMADSRDDEEFELKMYRLFDRNFRFEDNCLVEKLNLLLSRRNQTVGQQDRPEKSAHFLRVMSKQIKTFALYRVYAMNTNAAPTLREIAIRKVIEFYSGLDSMSSLKCFYVGKLYKMLQSENRLYNLARLLEEIIEEIDDHSADATFPIAVGNILPLDSGINCREEAGRSRLKIDLLRKAAEIHESVGNYQRAHAIYTECLQECVQANLEDEQYSVKVKMTGLRRYVHRAQKKYHFVLKFYGDRYPEIIQGKTFLIETLDRECFLNELESTCADIHIDSSNVPEQMHTAILRAVHNGICTAEIETSFIEQAANWFDGVFIYPVVSKPDEEGDNPSYGYNLALTSSDDPANYHHLEIHLILSSPHGKLGACVPVALETLRHVGPFEQAIGLVKRFTHLLREFLAAISPATTTTDHPDSYLTRELGYDPDKSLIGKLVDSFYSAEKRVNSSDQLDSLTDALTDYYLVYYSALSTACRYAQDRDRLLYRAVLVTLSKRIAVFEAVSGANLAEKGLNLN